MKKEVDRRSARTRRALHEALISLILRKGYDAITVQEIIDEADIGRATFYAHYRGKEDLLRGGFAALRAELKAARDAGLAQPGTGQNGPLAFSLALYEHACAYKDVYRAVVGGRGGAVAIQEIRRVLSELVKEELSAFNDDGAVSRELALQFIVGTFLTVLTWCLERQPKLAPAQADAMFRRLAIDGIGRSIGGVDGKRRKGQGSGSVSGRIANASRE
jgi:AcrR family transcriptional regulator